MKQLRFTLMAAIALLSICTAHAATPSTNDGQRIKQLGSDAIILESPSKQLEMKFSLIDGVPYYELYRMGKAIVLPSRLGFELAGIKNLDKEFELIGTATDSFDETWQPVWGEEANIRNHYNELLIKLKQQPDEQQNSAIMHIRFKLYDDG